MTLIAEYPDLVVYAPEHPLHSRENGGQVTIRPVPDFEQRYDLPLELAARYMHLSMVVGEAFTNIMRREGIDVVRINYLDLGNWAYKDPRKKPHVHLHLFGRTLTEKHPADDPGYQAFPNVFFFPDKETGYYKLFKPLTIMDCSNIKTEMNILLQTPKYHRLKF